MATTFGTRPEDTVADSRGNVLSGVALTLYATKSDATAQTSVIATVTTNSRGLWSYTDASARSGLWARDPGGNVWAVAAEEQQAVIDGKASQTALNNVVNGTTSLGTLYRPNPSLVASLPNPAYIAHRGGGGTAPEATMEAFRASLGAGADGIEMDIQPLADGGLAVIHDTTVDRTTDGTGSVSAFTTGSWKVLNAAAKFPWGGRVVAPPIWREVVAEFGGRAVVMVEPKDAPNYADIHAAMAAHKLQGSVIIATSTTSVLSAAKADGYAVYFYWGGSIASPTPASVVALGADFLGIDGVARPDAEVTTLVATGKPVFPYTINRRVRAAQLLALGVKGFLSDHPFYLKRTTALQTYDSWR
jgi:glycerophosphoryl diester phosphodiesterase